MNRHAVSALVTLSAFLVSAVSGCSDPAGRSDNVPGIPVYPNAILIDRFNDDDRDPTDIYDIPGASPHEVLEWYRDRMADAGWEAITDDTDDVILYNDPQGCYGFVSATLNGDGVLLQISQQRPGSPCIPGRTATSPAD